MAFKKGHLTFYDGPGGYGPSGLRTVEIHGVQALHVETQAELDALHRLVAEGKPLPLKPAPGAKQPKR